MPGLLVLAAQEQRDSAGAQVCGHLRGVIGPGHPWLFQRLRQDAAAGERMSGGIARLPAVLIQPGTPQLADVARPAETLEHMMQIVSASHGGENRQQPRR
jgi:hypothetical protein